MTAAMIVKKVSIDSLIPDSANARKHSGRNIDAIADSLKEFDQYAPLVVQKSTGRVLVGNGRLEAMKKLGWMDVDVVEYDCDNVTATRLALSDNRTAELATWDLDVLSSLLSEVGADEIVPGWTAEEMASISADIDIDSMFEEVEAKEKEPKHCPHCGGVL